MTEASGRPLRAGLGSASAPEPHSGLRPAGAIPDADEPLLFDEMEIVPVETVAHQSQLTPAQNKFHVGNGDDGKHYWLTPPSLYASLTARFNFDFDPCPFPRPEGFDGLTCEWGQSSYANIPFGSVMHQGPDDKKPRKKGPTAWVRKALAEQAKGKRVVMVYPVDKWLLMLLGAGAKVENLGDVRWCATEDGSAGKGTGRHIACFILEPAQVGRNPEGQDPQGLGAQHEHAVAAGDAPTP